MREIKFRAWDKVDNKLRYVTEIRTNSLGIKRVVMTGFNERTGANVDLMQFTGLKDKNGVEIYEGDILSPNNREIKWFGDQGTDMSAGWYTIAHTDNPDFFKVPFAVGPRQLTLSEVIGNIYENPELLK